MSSNDSAAGRPLALVTGASTGIGRELTRQLVERGHEVVAVADEDAVDLLATELPAGQVRTVTADLTTAEGMTRVQDELAGRPVAVAALNAGRGAHGRFDQIPLDDDLRVVELNVVSTVHLAKVVVRDMVAHGGGHLLMTASIAAKAPGPYHATYAASKAFVHSFAEALRAELAETGVVVTSLMPGPTDTDFFQRADMEDTAVASGHLDDPADVARDGLEALFAGKDKIVAGATRNRVQTAAATVLPDTVAAKAQQRQTAPGSGSD